MFSGWSDSQKLFPFTEIVANDFPQKAITDIDKFSFKSPHKWIRN